MNVSRGLPVVPSGERSQQEGEQERTLNSIEKHKMLWEL